MILVYVRPNSLAFDYAHRFPPAGARRSFHLFPALPLRGHRRRRQRHSTLDRSRVASRHAAEQSQPDQNRDRPRAVCDLLSDIRRRRRSELGSCRLAGRRHGRWLVRCFGLCRFGPGQKADLSPFANQCHDRDPPAARTMAWLDVCCAFRERSRHRLMLATPVACKRPFTAAPNYSIARGTPGTPCAHSSAARSQCAALAAAS